MRAPASAGAQAASRLLRARRALLTHGVNMKAVMTTLALVAALALPAAPATAQATVQPVIDRIVSSGRIVLAHRESSIPFSYRDEKRRPVGYALDLCLRIAEAVKRQLDLQSLQVDYLSVDSNNRIDAVAQGRADLECGSTTNNQERRQRVAFTIPHYIAGARYLVRSDSPVEELAQFEHRRLVSTRGSTPLKAVKQANQERLLRITVLEAADHADALAMVASGRADGFAMDDVLLYGLLASHPEPQRFKVVGKFLTIEPLAIMLPKDDPAFKRIVDDEMKRLIRSGEARAIYDRWFTKPIPPQSVALNLPMHYLLKDLWKYPTDIVPF
jgi:ABC-type amino acid transport substrate-binding protein